VKTGLIMFSFFILLVGGCVGDQLVYQVESLSVKEDQEDRIINYEYTNFAQSRNEAQDYDSMKKMMVETFADVSPNSWGENIDGVITKINTAEKVVALTFDACDGTPGSYDEALINFLIETEVPATLFIGGQWIEENQEVFIELANNSLFEIANHGYHHKPLSVSGATAYNISGTKNIEEAFDEVYQNQILIHELTGKHPKYFRSGTAYYDDVSVEMINELDLKAVNYSVLGDAGGTFNKNQIISSFKTAQAGSIFLFHMNKPGSDIARGVKEGIDLLKEAGYEFVQLHEYDELLK